MVVVVVVVELLKLKSRSVSEGNRELSSSIIDGWYYYWEALRLLGGVGDGLLKNFAANIFLKLVIKSSIRILTSIG